MIAQLVATSATILAVLFLLPQINRLVVGRRSCGVSPNWARFGLVANTAWVAYFVAVGLWPAAVAPGVAAAGYAVVLRLVRPTGRFRGLLPIVVCAATVLSLGSIGRPQTLGLILIVTPAVQVAPQVVATFRSDELAGLSPTTWMIGVGEAGLWTLYGMLVGDGPLIGYGLVTATGSTLVLGGWWIRSARGDRRPPSGRDRPRVARQPVLAQD